MAVIGLLETGNFLAPRCSQLQLGISFDLDKILVGSFSRCNTAYTSKI